MGEAKQLFGTDGIRGLVGVDPVTPSFAFHLGRVLACFFLSSQATVCTGRDTRQSSKALEAQLIAGLHEGKVHVETLGVMPTPGIAYCTRHSPADLGVAITASHNAFEYNGFKLFSHKGEKLHREHEQAIEQALFETPRTSPAREYSDGDVNSELRDAYLDFLRGRAMRIGKVSLTGVVDCAHGATTMTAPKMLNEVFDKLHWIGNKPTGTNINDHVGSTYLETTQNKVRATRADIGIAFDGDGDRVLLVDHEGTVVDGDQILYLLAKHSESATDGRGVVGTVMSNHGLQLALNELEIPFVRADVGDKEVYDELVKRQWLLGGEPSGHVIWRAASHTGDGVLIALCLLNLVERLGKSLRELVSEVLMFPQVQRGVYAPNPALFAESPAILAIVTEYRDRIASEGRLLVRPSGTEPLLRVMVEHPDEKTGIEVANALVKAISPVTKLS